MKDLFNIVYEESLDALNEEKPKKEYTSFEVFRHFCKNNDLIAELDQNKDSKNQYVNCLLYLMNEKDTDNKPVRFDFYSSDKNYCDKYADIFDLLRDYKESHEVTVDGTEQSPKVLWG